MEEVAKEKLFFRLTALWAFAESYLGGILHGLHLPVTGLILGSFSIICISTIYRFTQKTSLILKATLLVLLVKFSLSPQSPPPAYVAVAFQGILSFCLFGLFQQAKWLPFLLAPLILAESAIQRFLILWIWFGKSGFDAFHEFLQGFGNQYGLTVFPFLGILFIIYGGAHLLAGISVAFLIQRINNLNTNEKNWASGVPYQNQNSNHLISDGKSFRFFSFFSISVALLVFIVLVMYLFPDQFPGWNNNKMILLTVRLILIFGLWWLAIIPIFHFLFQKYFTTSKNKYLAEFQEVIHLFPEMKDIVMNAWGIASSFPFYQRLPQFIVTVFTQCIYQKTIE